MKKVCNNKKILQAVITLTWLLLISSSSQISMSNEKICPKLIINSNAEIDMCSSAGKDFVITIDLGQIIKRSDSLMLFEIWIVYEKNKVILDNVLTQGTLSEQLIDYKPVKQIIESGQQYNVLVLEGGNINKPVYGEKELVRLTGRYIKNEVGTAEFFINKFYLNDEFKLDYNNERSDTANLNAIAKNLPERTIELKTINDSSVIEKIGDEVEIIYELIAQNKKFLENFTAELSVENEDVNNIGIKDINIDEQFRYQIVQKNKNKIVIDVEIKDTANFNNTNKFCVLKVIRYNNAEETTNNILSDITKINEHSCSMNSKKNKILVVCQKDISIVDDDKINQNSVIKFSNDANTAFICSKLEIQNIKIYNIIGNEIHCNMKSIDNNSIQLDLTKLNRGLYFIRLKTQNSIENIKLTIN